VDDVAQFRLPDAGEGLTEAEIVAWRVRPGDPVSVNQTVVEIETAKSLVELPSPYAGTVAELLVAEGDTVPVGTPILTVRVDADTSPPREIPPAGGGAEPGLIGGLSPGGRTPVLVGYGPREAAPVRRRRTSAANATPARAASALAPTTASAREVLAKPPVRKLARDLGVDLSAVPATGPGGIVTREDVESAAQTPTALGPRETRTPISGVRKATAAAMVASAFTAPHVTEWVSVDVTRSLRLLRRLRDLPEFAGVKVTPLLLVAHALLIAVRRNPGVNATWDADRGEIVVRHYVNLGIAASTPRGLVVPNVKDAGRLTLAGLAAAIAELSETARSGRAQPADLSGGTITITNVGVFGVDGGTPILNPGEAVILAVGQIRPMPWVHKGRVRPREVCQLAVSFDHRLVDGDLGSRFLADVAAVLHDPRLVAAWS
jgi:pyruvate dehydrogenase E2 component (dihydrolipoamide acetyltransferase)